MGRTLGAIPMSLLCFPMILGLFIFNPKVHNIPHVFFNVLQHYIQCLQSSNFWCLLWLEKNKIHVQFNTFGVSNVPFQHPYYLLLSFLSFFVNIPIFLFFSIFQHPWCCLGVFFWLTKLRLFSNQNISLFWIFD